MAVPEILKKSRGTAFKKALREERGKLLSKCRSISEKAEAENRNLNAEEIAEDRSLNFAVDEIDAYAAGRIDGCEERETNSLPIGQPMTDLECEKYGLRSNYADDGLIFRDSNGQTHRALRFGESVASIDAVDKQEPIRAGAILAAAVTGRISDLSDAERRGLLGGLDSAGGYLLSQPISGMFVDMA